MRIWLLSLLIYLSLSPSCLAASRDFTSLRYLIKTRDLEAKMYLPSAAIRGSKIKILVNAPNSESIKLIAASQPGKTKLKNLDLRIDPSYFEVASSQDERASFELDLASLKPEQLGTQGNILFFEAIVSYQDPVRGEILDRASFYGANANFTNINAVQIVDKPEDASNIANLARSFMPGLLGVGAGY